MPWGDGAGTGTNLSTTPQQTWVGCFLSVKGALGNSWNLITGWKVAGAGRDGEDAVTPIGLQETTKLT